MAFSQQQIASLSLLVITVVLAGTFLGLAVPPVHAQTDDGAPDQLITRNFHLNSDALRYSISRAAVPNHQEPQVLREDLNSTMAADLRAIFAAAGVDLANALTGLPGRNQKSMFLTREGLLIVKATPGDLAKIETIVAGFNTPPQVVIATKFIEVPYAVPPPPFVARPADVTNVTILTEKQFREIIQRYEATAGVDVITAPSITTISGRQARVQTEQTTPILYQTPPGLPKDSSPDADPTPHNKGRLPFPPTFRGRSA